MLVQYFSIFTPIWGGGGGLKCGLSGPFTGVRVQIILQEVRKSLCRVYKDPDFKDM
jgi:hypothetical protein